MPEGLFHRFRADPAAQSAQPENTARRLQIREPELLAAVDRVPSLPTVVHRILGLVGSEKSSAADMEQLVASDMVIAGKMLRLVNSPFFGLPNPVASITQAVAIIGFGSLRSLVLAAATAGILDAPLTAYGYCEGGLSRNALVTAGLAREIARRTRVPAVECDEYFVAGLLRDVGTLVLGPMLGAAGIELRQHPGAPDLIARERAVCGFDHCWAGERVADKWQLPPRLRLIIARHHRIPQGLESADLHRLAAVRLAERLTYRALVGVVPDHPFDTVIDAVLLDAARIDSANLRDLVARLPELTSTSSAGVL